MIGLRVLRRRSKYFLLAVLVGCLVFTLYRWTKSGSKSGAIDVDFSEKDRSMVKQKPTVSIILTDFYTPENHAALSANYIAGNFSDVNVFIVSERMPYPPLKLLKLPNVKTILLKPELGKALNVSRPELYIKSDFVIFIPDGSFISKQFMTTFRQLANTPSFLENEVYAIPVEHSHLQCYAMDVSLRNWTLKMKNTVTSRKCDMVHGDFGLLLQTRLLYQMTNPFLPLPFLSLLIQLRLINVKVIISDSLHLTNNKEYVDPKVSWAQKNYYRERTTELYKQIGIKCVVHANGREEWYGCGKSSLRCFDTVYNDVPEYIYQGRWTPPCCLKNLRATARHVFDILDACKVRYWLEGGSLLGAARYEDIIPWDYDIDIGIYREDILKCNQLLEVSKKAFVDEEGFLWEKAIEGDFFRVQFSETNHLHVDIFPFYSKNSIMTKNTWFKTHRQDTEFPEHYLKPLTRIKFAGMEVSAPNNVRDFLEYKFGKGVIENPQYPNAELAV